MLKNTNLRYQITDKIASLLMKTETIRQTLRFSFAEDKEVYFQKENIELQRIFYSTHLASSRLNRGQVAEILRVYKTTGDATTSGHLDEISQNEATLVIGYYQAWQLLKRWEKQEVELTEALLFRLHSTLLGSEEALGYRDGQSIIRAGRPAGMMYMPPEAHDIVPLMKDFIELFHSDKPAPLRAALVHYQLMTIHPFYKANGRLARLLSMFILEKEGYVELQCLEEYYAKHADDYYKELSLGSSHNYYMGRAQADITSWIEYFLQVLIQGGEQALLQLEKYQKKPQTKATELYRRLTPQQRRVLDLFVEYETITALQIAALFQLQTRTASLWCQKWVQEGFLKVIDASNKARKYGLAKKYAAFI